MTDNYDGRLQRIEDKIDQLSDAMISLARAEEKLIMIEQTNRSLYDRLNRHSEKIDDLKDKVDDNSRSLKLINRIFWIIITAIITSYIYMIFMV
jgi:uncharacterized protein YoxC